MIRPPKFAMVEIDKLDEIRREARCKAYRECVHIIENNRGDGWNAISDMESIIKTLDSNPTLD